jgi:CRP/FNR family transcriptional regulator
MALFDRPLRAVRAREVIFRIADSARTVFIIRRGMVRLSRSLADGRCQILGFGVAGDILGLSGTDEYIYDAEALTEAQFCTIPTTDMMRRIERSPGLGSLLVEAGQRDLRRAYDQLTLLGKMTALEKLAAFYVQMARLQKIDREDRVFAAIPLTGEDIGDCLGLRSETVSRNQRKLRECGAVRPLPGSDRVEIRDMALLLRLAEGGSPRGPSAWA